VAVRSPAVAEEGSDVSELRFAYNTNGLANHRLEDALRLLADCGYDGVALTLDHHHLDPFSQDLTRQLGALRRCLDDLGLAVVIETGARFLLDPRRKHEPTLLSDRGRDLRIDFLRRAIDIAAALDAEAMSFWSGVRPLNVDLRLAWRRLIDGCAVVLEAAEERGVALGFEPEPGHLVDRLDRYDRLVAALGNPNRLRLTLDVGHCLCVEDEPIPVRIFERGEQLVNVHIEDMRRGVHEHLDFGEGEIAFSPVLESFSEVGYRGLVSVELSRHSHAAHIAVPRAIGFLRKAARKGASV
jgi:L-ribulose-5-phosphate 3-epimerase